MYDRETVELALLALEEGMTQKEAAELCGASSDVADVAILFWTVS